MAKQATRKPTAKKAIKAGKSTKTSSAKLHRDVSSQTKATTNRNKKKLSLQDQREEARRRAREWARRELRGNKNGAQALFPPASSSTGSVALSMRAVVDLNEEEEDVDGEEEDGSIDGDSKSCIQHVTNRFAFAGFNNDIGRNVHESNDDDIFFDALEFLSDEKGMDPDAADIMTAIAPTERNDVNVRDFHLARRRSLASKQVHLQSTTRLKSPLDPIGYSYSTFVSKSNP